jgi:hypothetical protein
MHHVYEWNRMTLMQNLTCLNISLPSEALLYATMPIMSAHITWCNIWSWRAICKKEMWSLSMKVVFCVTGRLISLQRCLLTLNTQNRQIGTFSSIWLKSGSTKLQTWCTELQENRVSSRRRILRLEWTLNCLMYEDKKKMTDNLIALWERFLDVKQKQRIIDLNRNKNRNRNRKTIA